MVTIKLEGFSFRLFFPQYCSSAFPLTAVLMLFLVKYVQCVVETFSLSIGKTGDVPGVCELKTGSSLRITEPKSCHLSLPTGQGHLHFSVDCIFQVCVLFSQEWKVCINGF